MCMGLQMLYREKPGPINGNTDGRDQNPEFSISFSPNDTIIGVFGTTMDQFGYTRAITTIGFYMASGRQYGPYGAASGTPFSFSGNVYGIYGTLCSGTFCAVGFWTDAPSPPPAPPARPPPPPSPPPPVNGTQPNNGRSQSTIFGTVRNIPFDDGPFYSGVTPWPALWCNTICVTLTQCLCFQCRILLIFD
jgi:hypothetical protein